MLDWPVIYVGRDISLGQLQIVHFEAELSTCTWPVFPLNLDRKSLGQTDQQI